ncbi:PREDICTED: DNA replication complex GINS protein SLD5 [Rhagoletis zephyria]|uniref:DNA replication complex GINS protein SLD5 n=1 Tax=Rhagoletis zephyria TaxID=28612 RepID=UPI00081174C4|nr:PREDICTED: DNA replication complex GINS protein SLD5 [Rhagoletis zephyria]XP_036346156.1 DNA replication complex GINS protein SLD5-like [Rhagoletis pomonella]XP_036346247.1 LOW QUALITY PROTEIN: DNA replication complex GINS protein SLD5-like [Rhagoletis pomonella]
MSDDDTIHPLSDSEHIADFDDHVDEEELITAQKVLEIVETAWQNELCAPEILQHQTDMMELMLGQVAHMEENMKDLDKNDFRFIVHQMELERIRYVMASYLRCRLQKIETYTRHIINEEEARDVSEKRLSPEEAKYAQEYAENVEQYFQQVALQYMPNMQRSEADQRIVRPNLMSHVFIKANVAVPAVVVGVDDEEVDLTAGSQHIIPYQLVSDLIHKNQAQLI